MKETSFFWKINAIKANLFRLFLGMVFIIFFLKPSFSQFSVQLPKQLFGQIDSCKRTLIDIDSIFIPDYETQHIRPKVLPHPSIPFKPASFDIYFYILCGLLLFVGISIRAFPKYYSDLYRVLVRSGFRQKSIRDQLVQNKLASLGLNAIFFISGGIFIYLISQSKGFVPEGIWHNQVAICIGFLIMVYLVKYIALLAGGWIFSAKELVNNYVFLVFFVNKISGLFLLPVIIVLWLGSKQLHPFFVSFSVIIIFLLFLYRYFLILPMVRNKSGVSSFHFFLYLCTFEILPILLLVKFLVNVLSRSI